MEQIKSINREKQWLAVYTKPRNEKKVADRLGKLDFEVYCPLQTTVRQWSDRKKKLRIPVIPSYVFLKITEKERLKILEDTGVLNFVFWLGKPAIIPEKEIIRLKQFLEDYSDVEIMHRNYKLGDKVLIKDGPLRNEKGNIVEVGTRYATITLTGVNIQLRAKVGLSKIQSIS